MELSPILDLDFVWVDSEEEADFKAYVGVPRSEALDLGFAKWVDYGGIGSASVDSGEGHIRLHRCMAYWRNSTSITG